MKHGQGHTYLLFNKPFQVICQFSPSGEKTTLAAFGFPRGVYPVGRLDFDSEGLLLLTDDPRINRDLLEPGNKHPRTYFAQVEGRPDPEALKILEKGVSIKVEKKSYKTLPCKAELVEPPNWLWNREPPIRYRANIPDSWLKLELMEGKNRQVRKMTAAIGFPTLRLIRWSLGSWDLRGLEPGAWKEIRISSPPGNPS